MPYLEERGIECTPLPLLNESYLHRLYAGGATTTRIAATLLSLGSSEIRRFSTVLRTAARYDVIYLEYEAFPYVPAFLERVLFGRNPRIVVDYDDPIYLRYERLSQPVLRYLLAPKIRWLMANSCRVIVANSTLAAWARQQRADVAVIPTSVDLRRYPVTPLPPRAGKPVIGWIGTPVTADLFLKPLIPALSTLRSHHDFTLKVIGAPNFIAPGLDVQIVHWSEVSEVDELRGCDVGIMPLPDDEWSRGKSALKLIQYLASGVSAVGSAVGTNCEVIQDGHNGFLARSDNEWVDKLALLIENPALRTRLAAAGRRSVEQRFSLETNAPILERVLREAATGSCAGRRAHATL